jgi:hypothetical protein
MKSTAFYPSGRIKMSSCPQEAPVQPPFEPLDPPLDPPLDQQQQQQQQPSKPDEPTTSTVFNNDSVESEEPEESAEIKEGAEEEGWTVQPKRRSLFSKPEDEYVTWKESMTTKQREKENNNTQSENANTTSTLPSHDDSLPATNTSSVVAKDDIQIDRVYHRPPLRTCPKLLIGFTILFGVATISIYLAVVFESLIFNSHFLYKGFHQQLQLLHPRIESLVDSLVHFENMIQINIFDKLSNVITFCIVYLEVLIESSWHHFSALPVIHEFLKHTSPLFTKYIISVICILSIFGLSCIWIYRQFRSSIQAFLKKVIVSVLLDMPIRVNNLKKKCIETLFIKKWLPFKWVCSIEEIIMFSSQGEVILLERTNFKTGLTPSYNLIRDVKRRTLSLPTKPRYIMVRYSIYNVSKEFRAFYDLTWEKDELLNFPPLPLHTYWYPNLSLTLNKPLRKITMVFENILSQMINNQDKSVLKTATESLERKDNSTVASINKKPVVHQDKIDVQDKYWLNVIQSTRGPKLFLATSSSTTPHPHRWNCELFNLILHCYLMYGKAPLLKQIPNITSYQLIKITLHFDNSKVEHIV